MLQRAASNAYSWWWASHIRTKQSKWLEQNLQDMEEKVQSVIKLIEEDGDSFAKRAEMYYKKRPELINFVEESYRAYRALADRYDHMSTELQNANNTIAYVFPEQVQFAMEDEEEEMSSKFPKKTPDGPKSSNAPKVPKIPKDLKGFIASATKKFQSKKPNKLSAGLQAPRSGLSKSEGLKEIDKLQKHILALQTEKEFIKGSYENGVAKYWEIDQEIREMQERVCSLQDEFGAGIVIEDDEARTLMASVALKSCQDTLAQLKEKQEKSAGEAAIEQQRIRDARDKLKSLKLEISPDLANEGAVQAEQEVKGIAQAVNNQIQERQDLDVLCEKIKEQFDIDSTLTVSEMAEKIDDLANKVFSLESAVSSQTSLIQSLRSETDELQAQIRGLEDDKSTLINEKRDMRDKFKEMEDRIFELQNMSQKVEEQSINLRIHFTEAHVNLDHLSEKLKDVKPDEEGQVTQPIELGSLANIEPKVKFEEKAASAIPDSSLRKLGDPKPEEKMEVESLSEVESRAGLEKTDDSLGEVQDMKPEKKLEDSANGHEDLKERVDEPTSNATIGKLLETEKVMETTDNQEVVSSLPEAGKQAEKEEKPDQLEKVEWDISTSNKETMSQSQARDNFDDSPRKVQDLKIEGRAREEPSSNSKSNNSDSQKTQLKTKDEDEPDWKELFMNGLENREKTLLTEYTSVLRNFKEAKRKLGEQEEKKGGTSLYDVTMQLSELKIANAKKDEQIRALRQKLRLLQPGGSKNGSEKSANSPRKDKQVSAELREFLMDQPGNISAIEEKFRANIDEVLEENLDFWMRFSSTFQQIQKFETEVKDLQSEAAKLEDKVKKSEGSSTPRLSLKSDAKPLYKHLREIHAELTVWIEKSTLLKEELKSRFSSLCDIQEEITTALTDSAEEEDFSFTSYQAAKFQGEILNMKQENNKVADELQAGLDHVTTLQLEVEKSLAKLNERFKLSGSKNRPNIQLQHSESRSRVPLRSFIFGVKPKKQKNSIFSCMHPALNRKYAGLRLHPSKGV